MIKKIPLICFSLVLFGAVLSAGINIYMKSYASPFVYTSLEDIPPAEPQEERYTALVLGAMVYGTHLSSVLQDRVDAGILCYTSGRACTLLLSGDHGKQWYDEVNAMRLYVQRRLDTIEYSRIFLDHAGFDTYDSLYRAKEIFRVKNLIVISQEFHIYRSVYIGRKLGLNVYGLALSEEKYTKQMRSAWRIREYMARVKAFADTVAQRKPRFSGEPIPVSGSGLKTWDIFEDK